jgi:ClpP class serine protease
MWLLRRDVAAGFERFLALGIKPTDAQLAKFLDTRRRVVAVAGEVEAARVSTPSCLTIAGDVAEICVGGVLTPQPDFWAWLFYGANTSYAEIRESLGIAATDPAVKRVQFSVDSPGGQVAGLFECLGAIEAFEPSKKRSVKAALAASAAYSIAAVAGPIEATSIAAEFGSIGVAQTFVRYADVKIIDITSTEAPDKRPDPETPEGQAVIRRELDAIHEIFVDAIARGRTSAGRETTTKEVNAEFGRGAVFLAREAYARGMIDKTPPRAARAKRAESEDHEAPPAPSPAAAAEEEIPMNLEKLKAEHPELYRSIVEGARAEGETAGAEKERKRVTAHLTLGKKCGAMDFAIKCISEGKSSLDEDVNAEYIGAAATRREQNDRQSESDEAGAATKGAKPVSAGAGDDEDLGDQVVAALDKGKAKKA